jgi:hypothetical protein
MAETTIGSEIKIPNQRFLYVYDFTRLWPFQLELINVSKEENPKLSYPAIVRTEGIAPSQYGTKSILGDRFVDVEEKYDLTAVTEGFGEEGEDGAGDAGDAGDAHREQEDDAAQEDSF